MTKEQLKSLSGAETEIIMLLWYLQKATVQEVCENLPKDRTITYATVQTLLRRLEKKGYISHQTKGKAHVFYPVVRKEEVVGSAVRAFVDRFFGGNCSGLAQYLAGHGKIKSDDIEKLRKITENKEE